MLIIEYQSWHKNLTNQQISAATDKFLPLLIIILLKEGVTIKIVTLLREKNKENERKWEIFPNLELEIIYLLNLYFIIIILFWL